MRLLNKDYIEELARTTVLNTEFDSDDSLGESIAHAEWEVDKALACEFAYLAGDDTDDPDSKFFTMAENVREDYDIDIEEYVKDMVDANEYIRDRELARVGL